MNEIPEVGDMISVKFEGEHASQSPITGKVTEVDTDPEVEMNDLFIKIDNGENAEIHLYRGGDWTSISRYSEFSGSHTLGDNCEWKIADNLFEGDF